MSNPIKVKRLHTDAVMPRYQTGGAAAFDLSAVVDVHENHERREQWIRGGDIVKVRTGLAFEIPSGYVGLITLRSSIGGRGFLQPNAPGVIDSDYRGEVCVLMTSTCTQLIKHGERIAQMLIVPVAQAQLVEAAELSETERGAGGFGSTGR